MVARRDRMPHVERWQTQYVRYKTQPEAHVSGGGWDLAASRRFAEEMAGEDGGLLEAALLHSPLSPRRVTLRVVEAPAEFAVPVKQDRCATLALRGASCLWSAGGGFGGGRGAAWGGGAGSGVLGGARGAAERGDSLSRGRQGWGCEGGEGPWGQRLAGASEPRRGAGAGSVPGAARARAAGRSPSGCSSQKGRLPPRASHQPPGPQLPAPTARPSPPTATHNPDPIAPRPSNAAPLLLAPLPPPNTPLAPPSPPGA